MVGGEWSAFFEQDLAVGLYKLVVFGETLGIHIRFKLSDSFIGPFVIGRTENFLSEIRSPVLGLRRYQCGSLLLHQFLVIFFLFVSVRESQVSVAPRPAWLVLFNSFFANFHMVH